MGKFSRKLNRKRERAEKKEVMRCTKCGSTKLLWVEDIFGGESGYDALECICGHVMMVPSGSVGK